MTNPNHLKQQVPNKNPDFPIAVFHVEPPGKQILHLHWHDEWEILYLDKGPGLFHIGAEQITAGTGDILFINKGLMHTGFQIQDHTVEYHAIVFEASLLGSSIADSYQLTGPFSEGKWLFPSRIPVEDPDYPHFQGLVRSIIDEYKSRGAGYQLAIRSLLNLILVHFARHPGVDRTNGRSSGFDMALHGRFKDLISYIEDHYYEKITVEKAASIVSLSPSHFCRTFKKMTGKTFVDYLNLHRLNMAERMLLETSDSITEIAAAVGFESLNYFSQMFKEYKQYTPSQCRKKTDRGA